MTTAITERYLDVAAAIGDELVQQAAWHEDRCTWWGDELEQTPDGWQIVHRTCRSDLYAGTSGIALVLAHLWKATGEPRLRQTAAGALRHALRESAGEPAPGLYEGTAGVAWVAVAVGELLDMSAFVDSGAALAGAVAEHDGGPTSDLVAGSAGTLAGLVAIAGRRETTELLPACRRLADRLLAGARRSAAGWSWPSATLSPDGDQLCGLAHGASGVAYALLELEAITGRPELRSAAAEAARYERSWFDRARCNWPDLRDPLLTGASSLGHPAPTYPVYWCHGAVGIGLARLRAHQLTGDSAALADAGAALHAARSAAGSLLSSGATGHAAAFADFSLCHGTAGLAELLLSAYQVTGHQEHLDAARRIGDHMDAVSADATGWPSGVPGGTAPGLMLGLAGIAACHLRLWDASAMPSPALVTASA